MYPYCTQFKGNIGQSGVAGRVNDLLLFAEQSA